MADEAWASRIAQRLSDTHWLDGSARTLTDISARQQGRATELAGGRFLDHPVHPALTDLPIGLWTGSFLLDVFGRRAHALAPDGSSVSAL